MKYLTVLALAAVFACVSVEAAPRRFAKKIALTKSSGASDLDSAVERFNGDIKLLKTNRAKRIANLKKKKLTKAAARRLRRKLSKKARVVYYGSVRVNRKKYNRIALRKKYKTYAAVRVQKKCPKNKKITNSLVKSTLEKSLDEGKYYQINCGGKVTEVRTKKVTKKVSKKSDD